VLVSADLSLHILFPSSPQSRRRCVRAPRALTRFCLVPHARTHLYQVLHVRIRVPQLHPRNPRGWWYCLSLSRCSQLIGFGVVRVQLVLVVVVAVATVFGVLRVLVM
jgi:hypothetical protein